MSNKKQCPKCSEDNPAEAVMCWACYTPLGGSTLAAPRPAANVAHDDGDKKAIQPWQLGLVGVALLVGVVMGVRTLLPSGETVDQSAPALSTIHDSTQASVQPNPAPLAPAPVVPQSSAAVAPPPPAPEIPTIANVPYRIVLGNNPRSDVAILAIVPTKENPSDLDAVQLAAFLRGQMKNLTRYREVQIYVFRDLESANSFKAFQARRRNLPLSDAEFRKLSPLWPRAIAVYDYNQGAYRSGQPYETAAYPYKGMFDWWNHWSTLSRA